LRDSYVDAPMAMAFFGMCGRFAFMLEWTAPLPLVGE